MKTIMEMDVKKTLLNNYLIKSNNNVTFLVCKNDTEKKYIFKDSSKIIIDNINKSDDEIIDILFSKYKISKDILKEDYIEFLNSLKYLSDDNNLNNYEIDSKTFSSLLESSIINSCTIEITNVCPFKCDHCYVEKSNKIIMPLDTFKMIIDQLVNINCYQILITGGEPLSHPFFPEMYSYAKEKGFLVSINTNAFLINDKILKLFKEYKPSVVEISLYGYNDRTYENFTHVKNVYKVINKNIKLLLKNRIKVNLKSVLTKRNKNYINRLSSYAQKLGVPFRYDYIIFPMVNNNTFDSNKESLSAKEIIKVINNDFKSIEYFYNAVKEVNKLKNNDNSIDKIFQCSIGTDRIFIDCYGNIKPCLVVEKKYSLDKFSVLEAIDSIKKDVCSMTFKTKSKCKTCYKRNICRYCPGRFFLETGNYEMPPKFYCDLADEILNEFNDIKFTYKRYNYDNKIPYTRIKEMLSIIILFYNKFNGKDNSTKEMCEPFIKYIRNTKDYNILLCYIGKKLVGFVNYMYQDRGLMFSEIQIISECQGKYDILRKMIEQVLLNTDKSRYKYIYGTINPKNIKSRNVFTHIGFVNVEKNLYRISYKSLKEWVERK